MEAIELLSVRNFSVSRNGRNIFSNLSLALNEGEVLGLQGANGAGKSTLLKSLAMISPKSQNSSGEILWKGFEKVDRLSRSEIARRIRYCGTDFKREFPVTTFEFIALGASPGTDFGMRIEELSEKLQVSHLLKHSVENLSQGECQRVLMAQALLQDPEVYLFDETFSQLDREGLKITVRLLQTLQIRRKAVIIVSHDPRIVPGLCTRAIDFAALAHSKNH